MLLGKLLSISAAFVVTVGPAALIVMPAYAQDRTVIVRAPPDDIPTRRVTYADLNLASLAAEKTLNRRVGSAVLDVCKESVGVQPMPFVEQSCRDWAWHGARPQVARAVQRAHEIASTGTSSIAATAITISAAH